MQQKSPNLGGTKVRGQNEIISGLKLLSWNLMERIKLQAVAMIPPRPSYVWLSQIVFTLRVSLPLITILFEFWEVFDGKHFFLDKKKRH